MTDLRIVEKFSRLKKKKNLQLSFKKIQKSKSSLY